MNGYSISKATLGRLPRYLEYLRNMPETRRTISATAIAKALSLGDVQVRKDLAAVSGAGKPKIGYETDRLITDIEIHLGHEELTNAILVGAGKLGKALLDYDGFEEFGVKIIAGFDCREDQLRINTQIKEILHVQDLKTYVEKHKVKLGIITVSKSAAQEVCDTLVKNGIKAIWNFAPVNLTVPDDVFLKQENLALSLAHLNNQLSK